jgi:hypothetical protein
MPRRLLILKCSARKKSGHELLPAIERYDGPLWQVLRSAHREQPLLLSDIDTYVLSAAFGLIPASQPIPWYDQTMSPERADELRPAALETLSALAGSDYSEICLGLSHRYLRALAGWEQIIPTSAHVTVTDGPMGTKLGQLRSWLYGEIWSSRTDQPERLVAPEEPCRNVRLNGQMINISRDEALDIGRQALERGDSGVQRYQDWYVLIDGRPIAPKWLVSLITGQSTKMFDASAARRVLLALGIDIERVIR